MGRRCGVSCWRAGAREEQARLGPSGDPGAGKLFPRRTWDEPDDSFPSLARSASSRTVWRASGEATRGLRAGLRRQAPPWRFRPANCLRNPLTGEVGPARIPSCDGAIAQLGERLHGMQEVVGSSPTSSTRRFGLRCVGSAIAGPTSFFRKIGSSGAGKARLGWRSLGFCVVPPGAAVVCRTIGATGGAGRDLRFHWASVALRRG
jgi:hypothetical protein